MPRILATLALCACAALCAAPAVQAAPVAKKTKMVCKNRIVHTSAGKTKRVRRCWKKTIKAKTTATAPKTASAPPSTPVATASSPAATELNAPAPDGIRADVRDCANSERAKVGLGPLKDNPVLDIAAQAHALDMKVRHYFAHDTPEGQSPFDRIDAVFDSLKLTNPFTWMGENIAMGFPDAESTCVAWMNSPGHRANILRPQFSEIGTGWIDGYSAQEFGGRGQ